MRYTKKFKDEDLLEAVVIIWKTPINTKIKGKLLDRLIWYITENEGKYNPHNSRIYTSIGYKKCSEEYKGKELTKRIRHDHVFTRKQIVKELLDVNNSSIITGIIAKKAKACLVTKEEHEMLKDYLKGWERYKEARIKVFKDGKQQNLFELIEESKITTTKKE